MVVAKCDWRTVIDALERIEACTSQIRSSEVSALERLGAACYLGQLAELVAGHLEAAYRTADGGHGRKRGGS